MGQGASVATFGELTREATHVESTLVEVESDRGGERLDRFLADRLGISRARVRHLLEAGRVSRSGRILALSDKSLATAIGDGFEIVGSLRAEDERPLPRPDLDWRLVAEGLGWLVVDKPSGCGVHPLRPEQDDTVLNAVVARREEIIGVGEGGLRSGVVHRLDVDTTGALAFATDEPHWKRLRGAFSEHRVKKDYIGLVRGRFEEARRVDLPLTVTRHHPAHVEVAAGGYACRQRVVPIEVFAEATLVEVRLETGFLHQIRATLAHLGHPIIGDAEYAGAGDGTPVDAPRQLLHAARLVVDEIAVEVPLPDDFEAVLATLRAGAV
jgi:23S rRNA pseudouridine1911/1915/1917 synthase